MPAVRNRLLYRATKLAPLAALVAACNAVVGIEEPLEIGMPDAGSPDAPAQIPPGRGGSSGSGGAPGAPDAQGGAPGVPDARGGSGGGGNPDAPSPPDTGPRDASIPDIGRDGAIVSDSPSIPTVDAREAGIIVQPGAAAATFQISEVAGASLDSSAFESTSGDAISRVDAGSHIVELNLTNFIRGVQRTLIVRLNEPPVAGKTLDLDDSNYVEYYEVKTGRGWSSAKGNPRGGSLKIVETNGTAFSFTVTAAKMGPHLMATGTFTMNGSGNGNPK